MKRKIIYLFLSFLLVNLFSCSKSENLSIVDYENFPGETHVRTDFDNWITNNLTKPYNIGVSYRWDEFSVELRKMIVPSDTAHSKRLLESIIKGLINSYLTIADSAFVRKFIPKNFILIGSANWNTNNTITLGTAEGGKQIVLFMVNWFDPSYADGVEQVLHTCHHEFGHILHQNIMYPKGYQAISKEGYLANWTSESIDKAKELGFVSQYSRSNSDEDFVEMISYMLVWGKDYYEYWLNSYPAEGKARMRKKEAIIVSYFEDNYGIDFYKLQAQVREDIDQYLDQ